MSYTDAVQDANILADAHEKPNVLVPIVHATEESVIGYGNLVQDFHAEEIIRVTWPRLAGSRPVLSGTGNLQVIVCFDAVGWTAGRASGLEKKRVVGCWHGCPG